MVKPIGWQPSQSPQSNEFPNKGESAEKLKKKGGTVLVFHGRDCFSAYSKNFTRSGGKLLGYLYYEYKVGDEFLNKFGRRLFLDDAMDSFFDNRYQRWEIDFRVLCAGYRIFKESPQEFEKLINKAGNKKEFLMAAGIS